MFSVVRYPPINYKEPRHHHEVVQLDGRFSFRTNSKTYQILFRLSSADAADERLILPAFNHCHCRNRRDRVITASLSRTAVIFAYRYKPAPQYVYRGYIWPRDARPFPTTLTNAPRDKVMLRKLRLANHRTSESNPDLSQCEQFHYFLYDQPSNSLVAPSKKAESHGRHQDPP